MQTHVPLTIITPVRNAGAYFARTLDALRAQTCRDFEYIVLDAVSTDNTPDLIKQYGDIVSYTHSRPDKGAVDAFNAGIEIAKGDFIAFLSADDWLEPNAVERIVAAHAEGADVISFGLTEWQQNPGGDFTFLVTYRDPDDGVFGVDNALYSPCISRCYSRALYLRHGLYRYADYGHFSDRELQLRFALHRPTKTVIPQVLYHFRKHDASATGNAAMDTVVKSMSCNRRIAEYYLADAATGAFQKRSLLRWYGFAWVRELFFLLKMRRFAEAGKIASDGLLTHPISCLFSLFSPDMPEAYRGQSKEAPR